MDKRVSYSALLFQLLDSFIIELRERKIIVTAEQHIQLLKVFERFSDQITSKNLIDFISPVLVKNRLQYGELQKAYDAFLKKKELQANNNNNDSDSGKSNEHDNPVQSIWSKYRTYIFSVLLFFVFVGAIIIYVHFVPVKAEVRAKIQAVVTDVERPVVLDASQSFPNLKDTASADFIWRFGDGTTVTSGPYVSHKYPSCGKYEVSVKIVPKAGGFKVALTDTTISISVQPIVDIQSNMPEIFVGDSVQFRIAADASHLPPTTNQWFINDSLVAENTSILRFDFERNGNERVRFLASNNAGCSFDVTEAFTIHRRTEESDISIVTTQKGSVIEPPREVRQAWVWGLIFLAVVPVSTVYIIQRRRELLAQRIREQKADQILSKLNGKEPPYDVPFKNHDSLIEDEKLLHDVAKSLKRRLTGHAVSLNISKTIHSTVKREGMLEVVWANKTRPVEYLFLIDTTRIKSQQVKVFEYLLKKLNQNDIYFEKYYFKRSPEQCYASISSREIHISRLHDLYPDHIPIILGSGHQLIDQQYPSLNEGMITYLRKWSQWAVCTPIPLTDWTVKEKLISDAAYLVPADLDGIMLLTSSLQNDFDYRKQLKYVSSYPVKRFNFKNAAQIREYLNDEFLFQWVCSMAVFPKLEWQILIVLGDTIKVNYPGKCITYTNLLKLSRISWMQDGTFPDGLRLQLLKMLDPANEKLAREKMIRLLDEVANSIDESSFCFEDLHMQRITDKSILYNHDRSKYKEYETDDAAFRLLWEAGKTWDYSLEEYLKKDGQQDSWSTLIGNDILSPLPSRSTPYHSYKENRKAIPARVGSICLSILAILFLASLVLLDNQILRMGGGGRFYKDVASMIPITFNAEYPGCIDSLELMSENTNFSLHFSDGSERTLTRRNPTATIRVPYQDLQSLRWKLTTNSTTYEKDTTIRVRQREVTFSLLSCPPSELITFHLRESCRNNLENFRSLVSRLYPAERAVQVSIDSSTVSSNTSRAACIDQVAFGELVPRQRRNEIVNLFAAQKIFLATNNAPPVPLHQNQVVLFSSNLSSGPPAQKFNVYIQYNSKKLYNPIRNLRTCINEIGFFNAPASELRTNFTSSQIRYYNNSFAKDSLALLQRCLKKLFPEITFNAVLYQGQHDPRTKAEVWIYQAPITESPQLTIRYNHDSLRVKAQRLGKALTSAKFPVERVELDEATDGSSKIRYYNQKFSTEAEKLVPIFKTIFPDYPVSLEYSEDWTEQLRNTVVIYVRNSNNEAQLPVITIMSQGRTDVGKQLEDRIRSDYTFKSLENNLTRASTLENLINYYDESLLPIAERLAETFYEVVGQRAKVEYYSTRNPVKKIDIRINDSFMGESLGKEYYLVTQEPSKTEEEAQRKLKKVMGNIEKGLYRNRSTTNAIQSREIELSDAGIVYSPFDNLYHVFVLKTNVRADAEAWKNTLENSKVNVTVLEFDQEPVKNQQQAPIQQQKAPQEGDSKY